MPWRYSPRATTSPASPPTNHASPAACPYRANFPSRPASQSRDLAGKTILLYGEQGYGDALQFLRFVPWVKARGGRIVLEILPPLARLAGSLV